MGFCPALLKTTAPTWFANPAGPPRFDFHAAQLSDPPEQDDKAWVYVLWMAQGWGLKVPQVCPLVLKESSKPVQAHSKSCFGVTDSGEAC